MGLLVMGKAYRSKALASLIGGPDISTLRSATAGPLFSSAAATAAENGDKGMAMAATKARHIPQFFKTSVIEWGSLPAEIASPVPPPPPSAPPIPSSSASSAAAALNLLGESQTAKHLSNPPIIIIILILLLLLRRCPQHLILVVIASCNKPTCAKGWWSQLCLRLLLLGIILVAWRFS